MMVYDAGTLLWKCYNCGHVITLEMNIAFRDALWMANCDYYNGKTTVLEAHKRKWEASNRHYGTNDPFPFGPAD